jgi:hypothetical protein
MITFGAFCTGCVRLAGQSVFGVPTDIKSDAEPLREAMSVSAFTPLVGWLIRQT